MGSFFGNGSLQGMLTWLFQQAGGWWDTLTPFAVFDAGIGVAMIVLGIVLMISEHRQESFGGVVGGSGGAVRVRPQRGAGRRPSGARSGGRPRSVDSVTGKSGREFQGSQRVFRERDSGAPLPTAGAFGEWLERDRS